MEAGEGYEGEDHFWTGDLWGLTWICREESGVREWEGLVQGHWFAGGFGHGGQDIHMISWSQEVDLVGREDSRFGQRLHSAASINKASEQTEGQHQTQVFKIVYLFYFSIKFYCLWINLYANVLRMCSIKGIFEFY